MAGMSFLERISAERIREMAKFYPVICIVGARQVGKSTLVRHLWNPEIETVLFDPTDDVENARKDPDFFLQNHGTPLFLDEIQYAPEVLSAIKRRVDREKKPGMYILSGSQNLSVLKGLSESLAGRVGIIELHPMNFRERQGKGNSAGFLKKFLQEEDVPKIENTSIPQTVNEIWRGGFPSTLTLSDDWISTYYNSYKITYMERDVRTAGGVGDLQDFGNFISYMSALTGTEINFTELGRELGIDRKTAQRWLSVLERTFLWKSIQPFHRNTTKKLSHKKKGYFIDTGLACTLQKITQPSVLLSLPGFGRLFETLVFSEIYKDMQSWNLVPNLYHYRTRAGAETDLILEIDGKLFPIEIKAAAHPKPEDGKGIKNFRETFPKENIRTGLIICSVEKPFRVTENLIAAPWWIL